MDRSTGRQFLLSMALLLVYTSTVTSLHCFSCSYSKLETENTVVSWFLGQLSKLSDEHCLLAKESDRYDAKQTECPDPEEGKIAKCAVFNGTVTTTVKLPVVSDPTVMYHSVVRKCIEVDADDDEYDDGCHDDLPSTAHGVLDSAFSTLDIGETEFEGKACYAADKTTYANTYTGDSPKREAGILALVFGLAWVVAHGY